MLECSGTRCGVAEEEIEEGLGRTEIVLDITSGDKPAMSVMRGHTSPMLAALLVGLILAPVALSAQYEPGRGDA